MQWLIDIDSDHPEPSQLTSSSGVVVYRLRNWDLSPAARNEEPLAIGYELVPGNTIGLIAVQVDSGGTLTIEVMPGVQDLSSFRGFSEAKRAYLR